jgi:DNA-directed RNA polymerase specialized sigma24 family protein
MVAAKLRRRLAALDEPALVQVAVWKREGLTNEEIAGRMGCVPRTVSNRLKLIRQRWDRIE